MSSNTIMSSNPMVAYMQDMMDAAFDTDLTRHFKRECLDKALRGFDMGKYQWMLFAFTSFGLFINNLWLAVTTLLFSSEFFVHNGSFVVKGHFLELVLTIFLLVVIFIEVVFVDTWGQSIIFGVGISLPRDLATFIDLVPCSHGCLVTAHPAWVTFGRAFGGLIASTLILVPLYEGQGWKYFLYATIGLKFALYTLRACTPFFESPKYLMEYGHNLEATEAFNAVAAYNGSPKRLTFKQLNEAGASGKIESGFCSDPVACKKWECSELKIGQLQPLFDTRNLALLTLALIMAWAFYPRG